MVEWNKGHCIESSFVRCGSKCGILRPSMHYGIGIDISVLVESTEYKGGRYVICGSVISVSARVVE